jgi:hypothetical protein
VYTRLERHPYVLIVYHASCTKSTEITIGALLTSQASGKLKIPLSKQYLCAAQVHVTSVSTTPLQASHNAVITVALSFTVPQREVLKNGLDVSRSSLATQQFSRTSTARMSSSRLSHH